MGYRHEGWYSLGFSLVHWDGMMECDGMDSRYSEWDITGYSHFHLMDCPKGTMQWDTKYCWTSVGNAGHV